MIKNIWTTYITFFVAGVCMMMLYTSGTVGEGFLGSVESILLPVLGGLLAGVSSFALIVNLFNLPSRKAISA